MEQLIVVHKGEAGRYTAQSLAVPEVKVEAESEEAAIAQARIALTRWFGSGKVVRVEVSGTGNPWLDNFGMFRDDPQFDDYVEEIKRTREAADEQP
jgi:hypothetical protein